MKIDSQKIILLHPGKTGGTSLEHTLRDTYMSGKKLVAKQTDRDLMFGIDRQYNVYLQHADLRLYNILKIPFREYKTITTVRRPYERILSCYYYNGKSKHYSFEDFVVKHLESHKRASDKRNYSISHFSQQYFFAKLDDYEVDHVLHQENLNEEAKQIGINVKYHYSKTVGVKGKNAMDLYTTKMKDIVYNLYKEDFQLFGYDQ